MPTRDLHFVIPTYRLRDVGETVEAYDEHFWCNGHTVRMIVFDDSTRPNHEKYYSLLENTKTHSELYYVGPAQKEEFYALMNRRLGDRRLESVVRNLFRPSYGGNRNFTLMYTLGSLVVSADDDMRPYAFVEHGHESLDSHEVLRGRLRRLDQNGYGKRSFDILAAFLDVLGKPVREAPENYDRGEHLVDTVMDLETNASTGLAREHSLLLEEGALDPDAIVKIAQTFRSGTSDVDAVDFLEMFLSDHDQIDPEQLNDIYVLSNFRPVVTNKNWRIDCGVAGYDNTFGLPPFFPTRLRFEDYIHRLWVQQPGVASAHVDAAQNHTKSNYMRNPLASEILNEEVSNLLKRKIKSSVTRLDDLGIAFDYEGDVTAHDAEEILEKIAALHTRALTVADSCASPERAAAIRLFAESLKKSFYGFEPDFFQQNLIRIVDDVVSGIKGSLEIWPTLVEICYFQNARQGLPRVRVRNRKK